MPDSSSEKSTSVRLNPYGIECPVCGGGTRVVKVTDFDTESVRLRLCTACHHSFTTSERSRAGLFDGPTGRQCPACGGPTWFNWSQNFVSWIRRQRTCRDEACGTTYKTKEVQR